MITVDAAECVTDLDQQSEMIIFGLILIICLNRAAFLEEAGEVLKFFENNQTTIRKFSLPKYVKRSV